MSGEENDRASDPFCAERAMPAPSVRGRCDAEMMSGEESNPAHDVSPRKSGVVRGLTGVFRRALCALSCRESNACALGERLVQCRDDER